MNKRKLYIAQIVISLLVCIVFAAIYIKLLTPMITLDSAYTGNKSITIKKDDIVSQILHNINTENIEKAISLIETLSHNENINNEIKTYFTNFKEFYYDISQKKKNTNLTTSTFIKNSMVLENYFGKNSQDEQAIIPYFCIKHYNAKNKKQEKENALYKDYIDRFVEGCVSLNKEGANVICLYIYSSYILNKKNFVPLKDEIEKYLKIYEKNLGDNGDLVIQRKYLLDFKENLREHPEKKPLFKRWNRMYRYPIENL